MTLVGINRCLACLLVFAASIAVSRADTGSAAKIALVIGNAAYADPLPNPVNDAKGVAELLRANGFTVFEAHDASRAQMVTAIATARDAFKGKGGVALFYYAGHGVQVDWRNYLVPVDAKIRSPDEVLTESLDVQVVVSAFKAAGTRLNIIVLDACRDNPFGTASSGKGLAQMDASPGTFIAYATAPGNVSYERAEDANSIYTKHLLEELKKSDSRIEDAFKRVRLKVRRATAGKQVPWESTSLEEDFSLRDGVLPPQLLAGEARAEAFSREKAEWDAISGSRNVQDFYAYLEKYPSGLISEQARARLEQLQAAAVTPQPDRDGTSPTAFRASARTGDRYEFVFKDGLTGVEMRRWTYETTIAGNEIRNVGAGMPLVRTTIDGFTLEDPFGTYDPPYPLIPEGSFQVGGRLSARTIRTSKDGRKSYLDVESRVVAREVVKVPVGTINAYKVVVRMLHEAGLQVTATLWFDPEWNVPVKLIYESRQRSGGAPSITVREMTGRTRGR